MSTVHDAVKSTELLYRLRTAEGELLYVGITRNWPQRMTQHQADKPWWSDVRDIEIVAVLGTRQQVEAIEKAVIKTEAPTYNKTHAVLPPGRVVLGARAQNSLREARHGSSTNITSAQRKLIIEMYSDYGPEWHALSTIGYRVGWLVEHPEYGEGLVLQCDDDPIHGDVRIDFYDDPEPYRCLAIQWAPIKTVAK